MKEKSVEDVIANLYRGKKWGEKSKGRGVFEGIVMVKSGIMGRKRAKQGGEELEEM